ncbi:hypothetical protein GCM10012287_29570 [Streptomyces daqingensis]|uniref:DUF6542 domain-containing protein n=1 Tax=Streptomyces daqingensis TaxID=1472640 RepID=A0ABQ2MES6_9ACTN|nr:DUF6542 domain-containing protein [Streptomyces daqingensis]GGO50243.1 hypothetical protein GCM10012287_29570 [Streptomyces daqingensis]
MEQQHSAHAGRKGPGQARGQGTGPAQGRRQGDRERGRKGTEPRAAAAASSPAVPGSKPAASAKPSPAPASARARRRGGSEAAGTEAAALYHAQLRFPLVPARLTDSLSWLPRARLTALGVGTVAVLLMLIAGGTSRLLFDGSVPFYGGAFLVTCTLCAGWVRPADLWTAPVAVPLAFTAGLLLISGGPGTQGIAEQLASLFPALAVNALWLYAGTLLAAFVVLVRKAGLVVQRSRLRALTKAQEEAEADEVA